MSAGQGGAGFASRTFRRQSKNALVGAQQGEELARKGFADADSYWKPQYDFGQERLSAFQKWNSDPNAVTADPSFKFRVKQGTEALENSAAARGGLLSGNTGKALQDYGQEKGSEEYQNQFSRWMDQLGLGQNATNARSGIAQDRGKTLGGMRAGMWQQYFNNNLAAVQEGRAAVGQLDSMIQDWMSTSSSSGGGKS